MTTPLPPPVDRHTRGDSFARLLTLPATFPNGYFTGWTLACQMRRQDESLVDDLECEWVTPDTTRRIKVLKMDTTAWPAHETLRYDVQLTRPLDGWTISIDSISLVMRRDETR